MGALSFERTSSSWRRKEKGIAFVNDFTRAIFTRPWGGRTSNPRVLWANLVLSIGAIREFKNFPLYFKALVEKEPRQSILETRRGLKICFRHNLFDARIIREIYIEKPYLRNPRKDMLVLDIGGYIGDFSIFAAKYHEANVIVLEPTEENYSLLEKNIQLNNLGHRIQPVFAGLGLTNGIAELNVSVDEEEEVHASTQMVFDHYYENAAKRMIKAMTLERLFEEHELQRVHLLKLDIEGAEFDVLETAPREILERIDRIVFEWHPIDNFESRLEGVEQRLRSLHFQVARKNGLVLAENKSAEGNDKLKGYRQVK